MTGDPRSHRRWRNLRAALLAHDDTCALCGYPGADTIDHIVELARGGAMWDPNNLRPMHGPRTRLPDGTVCRGNYSLGQRAKRARQPSAPSRNWGTGA